jgi:hypothetical protein
VPVSVLIEREMESAFNGEDGAEGRRVRAGPGLGGVRACVCERERRCCVPAPVLALVLEWGSYSHSRSVSEPEREWGSWYESRDVDLAVEGTGERDVDDMESGDPVRGYEDNLSSTCDGRHQSTSYFF